MYILIVILLFIIALLILYIQNIKNKLDNKTEIDKKIQEENIKLQKIKVELINEQMRIKNEINDSNKELLNIKSYIKNMEDISKNAFNNYCNLLENNYKNIDKEYDLYIENLKESYDKIQTEKINDIKIIQNELDNIRNTRAAAIEAIKKEKEIKENKSFYCLKVNEVDLADIKALTKIKSQLTQPRILSMLIWSTYYQKPMTQLCNNILGTKDIIGIYKITNQLDGYCYIGQSVNVRK